MHPYIRFYEMAKPRDVDSSRVYFHGTSYTVAGEAILKEGIKPREITIAQKGQRPSMMQAKPGMVYMTQNLDLALTHMIGFLFGEDMIDYAKKRIPKEGQYGWLFEIEGSQLTDIYPDEDDIGRILDACLNGKNKEFPWLVSMAHKYLSPNTIDKIKNQHYYAYYAQAGKKLMDKMTDEQIHQILDTPKANLAHRGAIQPVHAWKFDKLLYNEIKDDGNRFFDLAEEIR